MKFHINSSVPNQFFFKNINSNQVNSLAATCYVCWRIRFSSVPSGCFRDFVWFWHLGSVTRCLERWVISTAKKEFLTLYLLVLIFDIIQILISTWPPKYVRFRNYKICASKYFTRTCFANPPQLQLILFKTVSNSNLWEPWEKLLGNNSQPLISLIYILDWNFVFLSVSNIILQGKICQDVEWDILHSRFWK